MQANECSKRPSGLRLALVLDKDKNVVSSQRYLQVILMDFSDFQLRDDVWTDKPTDSEPLIKLRWHT